MNLSTSDNIEKQAYLDMYEFNLLNLDEILIGNKPSPDTWIKADLTTFRSIKVPRRYGFSVLLLEVD